MCFPCLPDICERSLSGECATGSYLNFWGWSFDTFVTNVSGSATDRTAGNSALFEAQVGYLAV